MAEAERSAITLGVIIFAQGFTEEEGGRGRGRRVVEGWSGRVLHCRNRQPEWELSYLSSQLHVTEKCEAGVSRFSREAAGKLQQQLGQQQRQQHTSQTDGWSGRGLLSYFIRQ